MRPVSESYPRRIVDQKVVHVTVSSDSVVFAAWKAAQIADMDQKQQGSVCMRGRHVSPGGGQWVPRVRPERLSLRTILIRRFEGATKRLSNSLLSLEVNWRR